MSAAPLLCPQCQTPYEEGDFLCTGCELILDLDAAEANYKLKQPSIVQALLSPPQRRSTGVRPSIPADLKKKGDPEVTVRAPMTIDDAAVPRLLAGMNLALTPLHEFEAMVAAFVDGSSTVPQIAAAAEISRVEAMAVFTSLVSRKVIELSRPEPPKPKPEPAKAQRPDPITLPPNVIELAPELDAEPPTPPPDEPLPPVEEPEPPPPPRARAPQPTDLPPRKPPRPPPVMSPVSSAPPPPAPVMTPSRTAAPATPARGAPVPTPVSTARPKPSQLQAPSPMVSAPKAESVLERAISLERRGEVDGAIHILKRAITQVKEPAALCNKLALILVNQRKDFRQAEELLNKAIELEPENAVYQQNLFKIVGMAAERQGSRGGGSSGGAKSGGFLSKLLKK